MTPSGTQARRHSALAKASKGYIAMPVEDAAEETGGGWGSRTSKWVKRHGQTAAIGVTSLAAAASALESGGTVEEISMVGLGMTAAALAGGSLATAAPMMQADMLHKEAIEKVRKGEGRGTRRGGRAGSSVVATTTTNDTNTAAATNTGQKSSRGGARARA